MTEPTRPLSIRLATGDIDQLAERAKRISGTPTGVARELILSGLSDGDPLKQAQRLLKIERRLAVLGQDLERVAAASTDTSGAVSRVETMFDRLLLALSGDHEPGGPAHAE